MLARLTTAPPPMRPADIRRQVVVEELDLAADGATVLVDPISVPYLLGSELDFVDDLIGASFKVQNPNATAACGCGTSFSV